MHFKYAKEYYSMLDTTDTSILKLIQQNAKLTIKDLSQRLNLTTTPIFERIKRMEREGYIAGYHARLNRQKVGYSLMVLCNVNLQSHQVEILQQFERDIMKLKEVNECFHLAGGNDYMLKVIVRNIDEYQQFAAVKLASIPNISTVQSNFVMTEVKNSQGINL